MLTTNPVGYFAIDSSLVVSNAYADVVGSNNDAHHDSDSQSDPKLSDASAHIKDSGSSSSGETWSFDHISNAQAKIGGGPNQHAAFGSQYGFSDGITSLSSVGGGIGMDVGSSAGSTFDATYTFVDSIPDDPEIPSSEQLLVIGFSITAGGRAELEGDQNISPYIGSSWFLGWSSLQVSVNGIKVVDLLAGVEGASQLDASGQIVEWSRRAITGFVDDGVHRTEYNEDITIYGSAMLSVGISTRGPRIVLPLSDGDTVSISGAGASFEDTYGNVRWGDDSSMKAQAYHSSGVLISPEFRTKLPGYPYDSDFITTNVDNTNLAPGDIDGDGNLDSVDDDLWLAEIGKWADNDQRPLIVSTYDDDGANNGNDLSLREALELAASPAYPGHDIIAFAPWVDGVELDGSQLIVDSDVSIIGPGGDLLTIDAKHDSRVFYVAPGVEATLRGLRITGGIAYAGGGGGGGGSYAAGIYTAGNLTIDQSQIESNQGSTVAGGIYQADGTLTVSNTTINDNRAYYAGGGVWLALGADATTFLNTTISGNSSYYSGGGIFGYATHTVRFVNSTVTNNKGTSSLASGFAITSAILFLDNTIIAGNDGTYDINASSVAGSNNVIGGSSSAINGSNNQTGVSNPMLSPLGFFGDPILTHALLQGSPAINAGNDTIAQVTYGLAFDQRGKNRKQGSAVDVGAYETGNDYTLIVTKIADENEGDFSAEDISLREAIDYVDNLAGSATIQFAASMFEFGPATILLGDADGDGVVSGSETSTQLNVDSDMSIVGPGANLLTLNGNNQDRVFSIEDTVYDAVLNGLTITGGYGYGHGGGIYNWTFAFSNFKINLVCSSASTC